jgi:hypothetical protein
VLFHISKVTEAPHGERVSESLQFPARCFVDILCLVFCLSCHLLIALLHPLFLLLSSFFVLLLVQLVSSLFCVPMSLISLRSLLCVFFPNVDFCLNVLCFNIKLTCEVFMDRVTNSIEQSRSCEAKSRSSVISCPYEIHSFNAVITVARNLSRP